MIPAQIRAAKPSEILDDVRNYFDQRADADQPQGSPHTYPNEELALLADVDAAIDLLRKLDQ